MTAFWLRNLAAYSLQIAVIVVAGAAVLHLLRIQMPLYRLRVWQTLLIACLLLPFAQPWQSAMGTTSIRISSTSMTVPVTRHTGSAAFSAAQLIALALLGGMLVRFAFLALGFWRLRGFRRESALVPAAAVDLQSRLGIAAEIRVLDIPGPVTFGFLRPVIILPPRWIGNESILCHELIHVRRKDWLATLVEEFIAAIFWFHPLIWWAIGNLQLAREQLVDREVVQFTTSRERYLETLLEIAAAKAGLDLAPAPLFLQNRHLRQRVASLLKEVHMSKKRLTLSLAGFSAAVLTTGWLAVHAFPLQAAPQQQGDRLEAAGLLISHRVSPQYPLEAKENHIEGDVTVSIQVDEHGLVSDAHVIDGPEELRQAALTATRQWTFSKESQLPARTDVVITFRLEGGKVEGRAALPRTQALPNGAGVQRIRVGGNVQSTNLITKITPPYPPEAKQARVQGRVRLNVLIGEDGRVVDVVLVEGEPILADAAIPAVQQWVYRPTLLNGQPVEVISQVDVNFTLLP